MANDYHKAAAERASQAHANKRQDLGQRPVKPQGAAVNTPTGKGHMADIPPAREGVKNRGANQ